jgi:hypothetical protein
MYREKVISGMEISEKRFVRVGRGCMFLYEDSIPFEEGVSLMRRQEEGEMCREN